MIDMLQNAKDLIAKGQKLGDNDLIQMGMELLEQYSPATEAVEQLVEISNPEPGPDRYVCSNCEHSMLADKPRKRCPECKKHKLVLVEAAPVIEEIVMKAKPAPDYDELLEAFESQTLAPSPTNDADQFHMQVRGAQSNRIHYGDDGKPDGIIRKIEAVDPDSIHNVWQDEGEDREDKANNILKKFTKVSPRTRPPVNYVEVVCDSCNGVEKLHPIHTSSRGRHICVKCIKRRSGR